MQPLKQAPTPWPERTSSFASQLTFSFLTPLLRRGAKATLQPDDLWAPSEDERALRRVGLCQSVRKRANRRACRRERCIRSVPYPRGAKNKAQTSVPLCYGASLFTRCRRHVSPQSRPYVYATSVNPPRYGRSEAAAARSETRSRRPAARSSGRRGSGNSSCRRASSCSRSSSARWCWLRWTTARRPGRARSR